MLYEDLEDEYVQTSLGKMHCKQRVGVGTKLIFLHGIGASTKVWKKLVEQLPDELKIYLIDLLGHGDSDAPEIDYTPDAQVKVVKELMEIKEIGDSYLFGHSYGGWIAALIAQKDYEGKGIVLEDAVGLKEYFDDVEKEVNVEEQKKEVIREALITDPREYVIRSTVASPTPSEYLTKESLSGLTKPALVLWGREDKTLDIKYARLFNEYVKGSELEIIEGAGHVPHHTHPERVKELLLSFITH